MAELGFCLFSIVCIEVMKLGLIVHCVVSLCSLRGYVRGCVREEMIKLILGAFRYSGP